jgi:hypothetical protein
LRDVELENAECRTRGEQACGTEARAKHEGVAPREAGSGGAGNAIVHEVTFSQYLS